MSGFFEHLPATGAICAHRGARSIAPENTLLAFEAAQRSGAHLLETDVQMSADEQLVLFHDRGLKRTTNVADHPAFVGRARKALTSFAYEELRLLDAGSWFLQQDPFKTLVQNEVPATITQQIPEQRIPLLKEVLEHCRTHDFPLNLEIKGKLPRAKMHRRLELLVDEIKRAGCEDLILVSSFEHDNLHLLKTLSPALATAALVERSHPRHLLNYLQELQVAAYHPRHDLVDEKLIQCLAAAGIKTNIWTVNDPQRFGFFAAAGATFICTDWPQTMASPAL
ncbi:glycerophosphodiester phosphodiesterase [Pelovirga terrestris]|uniref:Glycerophosphodiester phosphodiesterase n=1 Tax=Pelovirga terrestris TaxID=2771352 RepID=A0A8J6QPA1_9BACT|nr:glycerophosphodiester phosphodiesterase family protein [Pelovirga terrestris]MBD1401557.1 glycerophosphodiester phosphodiesterase [Pelovirga terrestris]